MSELNPIKIASVISNPIERGQVETLIASYRRDIIDDLTFEVVQLRNQNQADIPVYKVLTRILKELSLYR